MSFAPLVVDNETNNNDVGNKDLRELRDDNSNELYGVYDKKS